MDWKWSSLMEKELAKEYCVRIIATYSEETRREMAKINRLAVAKRLDKMACQISNDKEMLANARTAWRMTFALPTMFYLICDEDYLVNGLLEIARNNHKENH